MNQPARVDWSFLAQPAFEVFEPRVRERLARCEHFPLPAELAALTDGIPRSVAPCFEFAAQERGALEAAGGYDRLIADTARIPTRVGSHHDLLGALVWLHFPALKNALHRIQLAAESSQRGPRENAATHLDESGVLLLSSSVEVFEALAALRFRELLWEQREALARNTRFLAFGHGLLDSLRAPHPRLMAKALLVRVTPAALGLPASELRVFLDRALAAELVAFLAGPHCLQPLPVLGVPGWAPAQDREFYENKAYFRDARQREGRARPPTWLTLNR
jgi:hypothetical protein